MLDVHAPDHPVHGARDFFMHLFTITVGLFIALTLEAGVEALHHHRERIEAEEKIHAELDRNRASLVAAEPRIATEIASMQGVLGFLQAKLAGRTADPRGLDISFSEGPLRDAAWRTASATGVLDYMDYDTVQRFSAAYKEQDEFEGIQRQALNEYLQLNSYIVPGFDPNNLSADDIRTAVPEVRHTLADLQGMVDVGRGAIEAYDRALGHPER